MALTAHETAPNKNSIVVDHLTCVSDEFLGGVMHRAVREDGSCPIADTPPKKLVRQN